MTYDYQRISKVVGFYLKHQSIPSIGEVEAAMHDAENGEEDGAIRLLDWNRHCFFVKNQDDIEVMSLVFRYTDHLFQQGNSKTE